MGIGPALPRHADRFLLGERLSSTRVAEVFSGTDTRTGRSVVIKRARELGREPIVREYRVLSRLSARLAGLVPEIVGDGVLEPVPWFAMAFVQGGNLREFQHKIWGGRAPTTTGNGAPRALPDGHLETVLTLALELATALANIHGLGVVHGDLSPDNVLVAGDQRLVLIDFEVASEIPRAAANSERRATPGYAAPEALRGELLDSRADMYAWACIVRELLVGEPLFFGATASALARLHLDAKPLPAGCVVQGVPEWLDALLLQSLAKDARQRRAPACSVARQIALHLGRPSKAVDFGAPRPPLNHPGCAGRHSELRQLDARLEAAWAGAGGSVTVLGAPGVGKSSLLGELARRGQARGFRVLQGAGARVAETSPEALRRVPLLLELVQQAGFEGRASASANIAESLDRAILQSVLPDGMASGLEPSPLAGLPPESVQRRVFRALTQVLCEIGSQRPLLVLLDDLHEADEFTTSFLAGREAQALREAPVLIVAALAAGRAASRSTREAAQPAALDVIELGGLDRASTLQLVSELLGVDDGHVGCAGFLHEHCEGNPQLVTETLQHAIDQDLLRFDAARGWCFPEPAALDASCRATLKDATAERLAPIGPMALRVAAVAAAIGQSFELGELVELVDSAVDLQVVLRELIQHGILVPQAARYAFPHENLRTFCQEHLTASELHILHVRLAERLASRHPDDPTLSGRIGLHWLRAGRLEQSVPLLIRSAEQLEQRLEPFAAIRTLQQAFDAVRASLAPDAGWPPALLQVAQRLLVLFTRTAQHGPLRELAKDIEAKASEADWSVRYQALVEHARSLRVTGDYPAAGLHLDRAERLLRRARRSNRGDELWLDLQEQRIWLLYMKNDAQAIGPVLQRMAPVVRRRGSAKQLAAYYMWSANDLVLRNRYQFSPTAVAEERKGVSLLERASALPELAMAEFDLAFMLILGDVAHCEEALQHLAKARSFAERLCDPVLAARAGTYLAIAERRCGRISACHDWARLALEEARLSGIRGYVGAAQACLGWVAWRREDVRVALEHFSEAQKAWWHRRQQLGQRSRDEFPFQWLAQLPLVAIHASRDEFEAARAAGDELLAESQQRLSPPVHELLARLLGGWDSFAVRELDTLLFDLVRRAAELGYV